MKILIGGGGTGGHLIPGISLYQALKKDDNQVHCIFSEKDKSYDVSQLVIDSDKTFVSLTGISRKLSFNTIKQLYSIFIAWYHSFYKIKSFNPDIMIITGGYVSNIVALSSFIMRRPLYILEQNSVAGITNRFWAKYATKIFTTFPNPKFIPSHKKIISGNPLLYQQVLSEGEAKKILNLSNNTKPVLGICGGSQGAKKINDLVIELIPTFLEQGYQIVWSLGTKEYDRFIKENKLSLLEKYEDDVKVFRFITRMDAFWSAASLVLARSGAGTISEALFFQTPCLLIPILHSPDNHQLLNALYLYENNCALILEEPELTKETLFTMLKDMFVDLKKFHNFSNSNSVPTQIIINSLQERIIHK